MYENKKKEKNQENNISLLSDNIEGFQIQDMQQPNSRDGGAYIAIRSSDAGGSSSLTNFPDHVLPWPLHTFNHVDPFLLPPQPPPPLFNRRQFGYDGDHHLRLISEYPSSAPFGLHAELQKMSAQEIMDAKALAASKSHSEAERRRRERINNHLSKLRSLLPNTTKTDKASLLAEVIQHVKELKRQTCVIAESSPVPTEVDELTVDNASDEEGKPVIRASICCEDRSDLLPDVIKTLKELRVRTVKAEITTLGGRVKNVLFITGDDSSSSERLSSIQEALKAVMEKSNADDSGSGSVKRQRTNINILQH